MLIFPLAGLALLGYGIYTLNKGEVNLFRQNFVGKAAQGISIVLIVLGVLVLSSILCLFSGSQ